MVATHKIVVIVAFFHPVGRIAFVKPQIQVSELIAISQLYRTKPMTMPLGLLLIATLALSCLSTIVLNSAIAQPTGSQLATAKELSIMLLNKVKRYLPDASIVVGIISPNGTQVYGYGNISKANSTKVNGNTIFDTASITKTFTTTLLADMVKQGLVNLDDPIGKYLPATVKIPTYNGHEITLEDLSYTYIRITGFSCWMD